VRVCEFSISADLGSSSNYSNELLNAFYANTHNLCLNSFEGRSGKGFLASGAHARVSRS